MQIMLDTLTFFVLVRFTDIHHDCVFLIDQLWQLDSTHLIGAATTSTKCVEANEKGNVITTEASEFCRDIHPRMPMILDRTHHQEWLKASSLDLDTATAMLRPNPQRLRSSPVSRFVNSPANDSPQCISPISQA